MGVTRHELQTLLILERDGEQQLKELASKNQCSSSEQTAHELYLLKRGFMGITVKRRLTKAGHDYLASLREEGFIEAATE